MISFLHEFCLYFFPFFSLHVILTHSIPATRQELPGLQWCHKAERKAARIYQSCRANIFLWFHFYMKNTHIVSRPFFSFQIILNHSNCDEDGMLGRLMWPQLSSSQELRMLQWCHKAERIYQKCRAPRLSMRWTSLKQKEALQPCRDPSAKHNVGDHARRRTKTCNLATRRRCFITSTLSNYLVEKMTDAARSLHCSATQYPESGHLICESTTHGKGRWHVEKTDQSRETDPFFVAWCQGKVSPGSATLPGTSWYHSFQTICFSEVDSAWEPPPFVQSSNLTQCSTVNMILQRLGWTWRRGLTFNESGMLMS